MNTSVNMLKGLSALLFLSACTTMTGCADGSKNVGSTEQPSSSSTDTTKSTTLPAGPTKSTTPVSPDELIDFRGDQRSTNTTDYGATEGTYRLYGVDGVPGAQTAMIAELGTWITRPYKVGDAFGRGFVVSKIDDSGVTLHGAQADVQLTIGNDADLRVIRHDLDIVAQPLGKHRFNLSTPAAKAALDTNPARPAAEQVDLYDQTMLKLGAIPAKSLWAGADLREGDLIAQVDGKPVVSANVQNVREDALAGIETALTDGRKKLDLTIYRGGVAFQRSYEVDATR